MVYSKIYFCMTFQPSFMLIGQVSKGLIDVTYFRVFTHNSIFIETIEANNIG